MQSIEFNGSSETHVLISSAFFSRFIGAVSKHLKPYQHFSRMSSFVHMTSLPFQYDSRAEIDSLMPEGQHYRVNCRTNRHSSKSSAV
eukprot:scaffold33193_cov70-Cyclotella_meneghiniana.AAC.6